MVWRGFLTHNPRFHIVCKLTKHRVHLESIRALTTPFTPKWGTMISTWAKKALVAPQSQWALFSIGVVVTELGWLPKVDQTLSQKAAPSSVSVSFPATPIC